MPVIKLSKIRKGKGKRCFNCVSLAFFLFFICLQTAPNCQTQQEDSKHPPGIMSYPVLSRLDPSDVLFKQFISDVQANRRRLIGLRTNLREAAENLTIFQYTVRQGEDIFFLAARCNVPYSTIVSLNRINNPVDLEAGKILLIPSCPGLFIPENLDSDLETVIRAARQNNKDAVELKIRRQGGVQIYYFIPGADFTPTERGYFLYSGFRFPLKSYRITSAFGIRADPFSGSAQMHRGIDLAAPEGTEVYAAADGVVTSTGYDPVYGNYIIISHSNNWTSLYGHLQKAEAVLRSEVKSGTLIGRVGSTGQSTGPHLHFELRQDGRHFDPAGRLRP